MAMKIEDIITKENCMCTNLNQCAVPKANNENLIADNMQAFFNSVYSYHCEFSMHTKPAKNMNGN